jgi:hypothetical protein
MNCFYEIIAGAYVRARQGLLPPAEDDLGDAEENLESCRAGLVARERELGLQADKLARAAGDKKKQGDVSGARFALLERKRVLGRLEKVRNGIILLDKQLDALKSSELDKELMNSLKLSSQAMRKAGIGQGLEEAETVMNELDDQIREASELTTVLATPLVNSTGEEEDLLDVDAELGLIAQQQSEFSAAEPESTAIPAVPSRIAEREARISTAIPRVVSHMDF